MKKFSSALISLLILLAINYGLSRFFNTPFIEMSFITGIVATFILGFFSSEGGPTTAMSEVKIKHLIESNSRTNAAIMKFYMNTPFATAIVYTIIAGVGSIIFYWKYFL